MPTLLTIQGNNLAQQADNLTWIVGNNAIVFDKPFDDTNYVLDIHTGDPALMVKESPGSRTVSGVTVVVSGTPTESPIATGYYYAEGKSAEYAAAGFEGVYTQHGSGTLVEGEQWITFPYPFLNTTYTFAPIPNDGQVYAIEGSEEVTRIKVYSAGTNTNFKWIAHGRRG